MGLSEKSKDVITVYSRKGCHLCDVAIETIKELQPDYQFDIDIIYIDGDEELEKLYGEQVPVTHINGEHHDYWRIDRQRFISSLETNHRHQ